MQNGADRSLMFRGGRTGFLLIHGLGGTPVELRVVARGLHKAGFTVSCPQLAGHCGTEEDLVGSSWTDWSAGVERALDDLGTECDVVIIGGLSMGAVLAMHVASLRPQSVHGLALYAPTFWYDGWSIPWYSFLLKLLIDTPLGRRFRFVERWPYGVKDRRTRRMLKEAMTQGSSEEAGLLGTPSAAVRQMWQVVDRAKSELGTITQPALVIQSRDDDVASLANAHYLQRKLAGLVDTTVLHDSYHLVTLDRQSDIVIHRSINFARWLETQCVRRSDRRAVRESEVA
jgi:carboxylesterase